jgi:predicted phage-related endonuclease
MTDNIVILDSLYKDIISMGTNYQSNSGWLEGRAEGIGGTETSVLLGHNPYMSVLELFYAKTTGVSKPVTGLAAMRGKYLEPMVAELYKERTGYYVPEMSDNISFASLSQPYTMGTLDRLAYDEHGLRVVEIKTVGHRGWSKWETGPPMMYQIQLKKYIAIIREIVNFICPKYNQLFAPIIGDFAVFMDDEFFIESGVECSDEEAKAIYDADRAFWKVHVEKNVPPEPDSLSDIRLFYKEVSINDKYPEATEKCLHALKVRQKAKDRLKTIKEEHNRIEARLNNLVDKCDAFVLDEIKDNIGLSYKDEPIVTWKPNVHGTRVLRPKTRALREMAT